MLESRTLLSGTNSAPTFGQSQYTFAIPVDTASGTVIGSLTATDVDGHVLAFDAQDVFQQSAIAVSEAGVLSIANESALRSIGSGGQYQFQALVTDGLDSSLATVVVDLLQSTSFADNAAPEFSTDAVVFQVPIDSASGVIGILDASDADSDSLNYSGFDFEFGAFEVDQTGEVRLNASRLENLAVGTNLEFVAYVDDGTVQASIPIRVELTPSAAELNNWAPEFTESEFAFDLPLNTTEGTIVGRVTATDPNSDSLTFAIEGGAVAAVSVDDFGNVYVRSVVELAAFAAGDRITVPVTVSDRFTSVTTTVSIDITEGSDSEQQAVQVPEFRRGNYSFTVPADAPAGAVIGFVEAFTESEADLVFGGVGQFVAVQEDGQVVVTDASVLRELAIGATETVVATAASEDGVGAVDVLVSVTPGDSFGLFREFQAASQALTMEFDVNGFVDQSPFADRLAVFSDVLEASVDETEGDLAEALSRSQNSTDGQQDTSNQFDPLAATSSVPTGFQFLPDAPSNDNLSLPLQASSGLSALQGTESFEVSSTIAVNRTQTDALVATALPDLDSSTTITSTHSQQFESEDEFVITQSLVTTSTDRLQSSNDSSEDDFVNDLSQEDFTRTVTENFTITTVNGTQTTYRYTITNNVFYSVGELEGVTDQPADQPLTVPSDLVDAIRASNAETDESFNNESTDEAEADMQDATDAFFSGLFQEGSDSAGDSDSTQGGDGTSDDSTNDGDTENDEAVVESSLEFGGVLQSITSITVTLVETQVVLPDGRSGTTYELSLTPSSSHGLQAAGSASFSSQAGDLENIDDAFASINNENDTNNEDDANPVASGDSGQTDVGTSGSDDQSGTALPSSLPGGPTQSGGSSSHADNAAADDDDSAFDMSLIEGEGNGHNIGFNDQFATFGSESSLVDIGVSLTVGDGDTSAQFAPVVSVLADVESSAGGLYSSGLNFDIQESGDTGFAYLSIGGDTKGGGLSSIDYNSQLQDQTRSSLASANTERSQSSNFETEDTGNETNNANVRIINRDSRPDADGNLITEFTLASSGGKTSGLAEFGFVDGAFGDTGQEMDDSNHFFLAINTFESAGPETHTIRSKRQVTATFDFDAAFDDSGSVTDVILDLTDGANSSGKERIEVRTEVNTFVTDIPHLPGGFIKTDTVGTVTVDLDYAVDENQVGGTLTTQRTRTQNIDQNILVSAGVAEGEVDESDGPVEPVNETHVFDLGSEEAHGILAGLGFLPRTAGSILADLQERTEQAIRTQRIFDILDPEQDANLRSLLESQLNAINGEIAKLQAEAAAAGVSGSDIATAQAAAEDAVGEFSGGSFLQRLRQIDDLREENVILEDHIDFLTNVEIGLHATQSVIEVGGGVLVFVTAGGPIAATVGVVGAVRGLDHAVTGLLSAVEGQDRDTFVHQVLVYAGASEGAASFTETALDVSLIVYDLADGIRSIRNFRKQVDDIADSAADNLGDAASSTSTSTHSCNGGCGVGGCFVPGTPVHLSPQPVFALASTASRWTAFTDTPRSENRTVAIENVPLGSRVPDQNPRLEDYDFGLRNVDQSTWRQVDLQIRRDDGALIEMQLLRPVEWIDEFGLHVGGEAPLFLEELEVNGRATVTAIRPCCDIEDGDGSVVIGRFITHQVNNLIQVTLADGTDFTGTAPHPIWTPETQQWTRLEELVVGDLVLTHRGTVRVIEVSEVRTVSDVHNIEVHGHHVYRIASSGVLVHNSTPGYPDDDVVDAAKDIIGEASEALGDAAGSAASKAPRNVAEAIHRGSGLTKAKHNLAVDVISGRKSRLELLKEFSGAEINQAAHFFRQQANRVGGKFKNAARQFNLERARFLEQGGPQPPGSLAEFMKRRGLTN